MPPDRVLGTHLACLLTGIQADQLRRTRLSRVEPPFFTVTHISNTPQTTFQDDKRSAHGIFECSTPSNALHSWNNSLSSPICCSSACLNISTSSSVRIIS